MTRIDDLDVPTPDVPEKSEDRWCLSCTASWEKCRMWHLTGYPEGCCDQCSHLFEACELINYAERPAP